MSFEAVTIRRLRRVMAVFTGLLVASTWPLWRPGTVYPDIPWFGWAANWPPEQWDEFWLASLGGLLVSQFVPSGDNRRWLKGLNGVLLAGTLLLLMTDQHRLQPWVWQMLIGALLIGLSASDRRAIRRLRVFTVSIYVWSAVSKMDWAFVTGHGQVLLQGLADSVGLSTAMWSESVRQGFVATLTVGELAVAILLAIPSTRRIGVWSATVMHGGLILALGPTGLGHEWGVLIWNAFFVVQVWLLFGANRRMGDAEEGTGETDVMAEPQAWRGAVLTWGVCLLPVLSMWGLWDWWPSWAVYSSRPAIVQMSVQQADVDRLPESLRSHVGPLEPLSDWRRVNLDAWSYATCRCPMYPQERYRLAVIAAIADQYGAQPRVVVRSSPNRWTGERIERKLDLKELTVRRNAFWFSTSSRGNLRRHQRLD